MKKEKTSVFGRIKSFFYDRETIEEKVFWSVIPLTLIVGIASIIGTTVEKLGLLAILSGVLCLLIAAVLGLLCYFKGNCRLYFFIYCILLNCFAVPLAFLANGGLLSGMPIYCLGFLLFCSFCSRKRDRYISFFISCSVHIAVFICSKHFPAIVTPIRTDFVTTDIILSFAVAGISLFPIVSKVIEEYNTQRYKEINNGMIDSLGSIIEFRNLETGNHGRNIKRVTEILLRTANRTLPNASFSNDDIQMIASASVLHDIGKIAVPDAVLNKPGKLTDEEFEIMKEHPLNGYKMLESMENYQSYDYHRFCCEICRHHHEKYDGTGYPDKLKGEEIPLVSQIAGLADAFEALISERPYKRPYTPEEAFEIITRESNGHWSPELLECFKAAWPKLKEYAQNERAQNN